MNRPRNLDAIQRNAQILFDLARDGYHRGLPSVPTRANNQKLAAWAARHAVNGWYPPARLPRRFVLTRRGLLAVRRLEAQAQRERMREAPPAPKSPRKGFIQRISGFLRRISGRGR